VRVVTTAIPDVKLLVPQRREDGRGYFVEAYSRQTLEALGIHMTFVQDNHAYSRRRGTVRGLHYQLPPHAQAKLVRVVRGAVFDVAVDVRTGSPTIGRHVTNVLTAEVGEQVFVPEGFAHGICTLEPDTEVIFKITAFHAPGYERGLLWSDPTLGIEWPVDANEAVMSPNDLAQPRWSDAERFVAASAGVAR
jgi:dTDP-4-dehydrorhamnose 3,5-epimerase